MQADRLMHMVTLFIFQPDPKGENNGFKRLWKRFGEILSMDEKGEWRSVAFTRTDDGVKVDEAAEYLRPTYLLFR